jgi:Fic family protein
MNLLKDIYFEDYRQQLQVDITSEIEKIDQREFTSQSFTFYTSVAVMSSSRIEGEQLEIDSYVKHKMQNIDYLPELTEKPNDLYQAYLYAQQNKLNKKNFLHTHVILSQHLLPQQWRGVLRQNEIVVLEHNTGKIQYEAALSNIVKDEMNKLWKDITTLKKRTLTVEEIFYYASFIHLVFVNIHPFNDGNGRAARLLEKWFLAEMLEEKAWYIQSEKYYYHHVNDYYRNLARLGMFYEQLDYAKANLFLQMLPNAINYL